MPPAQLWNMGSKRSSVLSRVLEQDEKQLFVRCRRPDWKSALLRMLPPFRITVAGHRKEEGCKEVAVKWEDIPIESVANADGKA